jgi:hypothetical protein
LTVGESALPEKRSSSCELHPAKDRQADALAVKREGAGAIVQACSTAHALLFELGIAALLAEESLERRPAILDGLLGHGLGNQEHPRKLLALEGI